MSPPLILFVHGLGGHPRKTWGRFPELMESDSEIGEFEVGFFGFPTSLLRLPFSRRHLRIQTLAKALRTQLDVRYPGHDRVVLVCHSLGGLIARKYLVEEAKRGDLRVAGVVLFAVPNNGAGLASVARHISWRSGQLTQLCKSSDLITDLNEDWFHQGLDQKLSVRYVVAGLDRVVDEESAQAFWGNTTIDLLANRGHVDVVKPTGSDDLPFLVLKRFLQSLDFDPTTSELPASGGPAEEDDSDRDARIAIFRFRNVGGSSEHEAQSDGLTERLITQLNEITGLDVIPQSSMMGPRRLSIVEIRDLFHPDYTVEGSLSFLEAGSCTITVRLNEFKTHRVIWSEEYTRPWNSAQQILKGVARQVALHIKKVLTAEDSRVLTDLPVQEHEAWEGFTKGRRNLQQFNNLRQDEYFLQSRRFFRKALELDPEFDDAREQLGFLHLLRWETEGGLDDLEVSRGRWQEVVDRQPESPLALAELGYLALVLDGDGARAVELARRGVQADPEHSLAQNVLSLIYLYLGYYESNDHIESEEVIPRDPAYVYPYTNVALGLQLAGRLRPAMRRAQQARRLEPMAFVGIVLEGAVHFHLGHLDEAEKVWTQGLRSSAEATADILRVLLGWIAARRDDLESARELVERHRAVPWLSGPYGPYFISLCALAGENSAAIELLRRERTYAKSYRYLISEPTLRGLVGTEGFDRLLEARYREWRDTLRRTEAGLPAPPPDLPDPGRFLDGASRA